MSKFELNENDASGLIITRAKKKKKKAKLQDTNMSHLQLMSRDIDLGAGGAKWRHGWVPLNAQAVAIKARGAKGGGSKSRLSTSTARPSRLKLKSDKGRVSTPTPAPTPKAPETKTVQQHVKLAIAHNEAAKRALDRGDLATADRHVTKSREHNSAALTAGADKLAENAVKTSELNRHSAALAIPRAQRTPEQHAAADAALEYAKQLRAKRLAKRAPKIKQKSEGLGAYKERAPRGSKSVAGVKFK